MATLKELQKAFSKRMEKKAKIAKKNPMYGKVICKQKFITIGDLDCRTWGNAKKPATRENLLKRMNTQVGLFLGNENKLINIQP